MAKLFVGLTGSPGSGKSTALKIFRKLGAGTFNSDYWVGKAWKKGSPLYPKLRKLSEKRGLVKKGEKLQKGRIAREVFQNRAFRRELEKLIHPWIFKKIHLAKRQEKGTLVAEIPLLFETEFNRETDFVITVKTSSSNSIARLKKSRGLSSKEWKSRAKAQWPLGKKVSKSDAVIRNNGTISQMRRQIRIIWKKIKEL